MGNSLNEILSFLFTDGNISGIPNFNKSEMMASLGIFETHGGNSDDRKIWGRTILGRTK